MMNNIVFGELTFNIGWKTKTHITLFGNQYDVVVKVKAYFEKDGITPEQELAFADFKENKSVQLKIVEKLLNDYTNGAPSDLFIPRTLLFNRDGSYALLLDDSRDEEGGVAVILAPVMSVIAQNEYL